MGVYLSKPIKEKVSSDCENSRLKCGASSMQGWRVAQEDAHNCCLEFDTDTSLFAVYDGHGGHEVAEYTALNLPDLIKSTEAYKKSDFEQALKDAFLEFDATLKTKPVVATLKKIASKSQENTNDEDLDEDCDEGDIVEKLKKEAVMPICDVMAQYTGVAQTPILQRLTGGTSKPISPFLKAKSSNSSDDVSHNEVSSSEDCKDSSQPIVNGVAEVNGTIEEGECSGSATSSKTACVDDSVPSSSQNGEVSTEEEDPVEGSSKSPVSRKVKETSDEAKDNERAERIAKTRGLASLISSLLEETSDESDSDNDESFHITENPSSDEGEDEAEEAEGGEEVEDEEDEEDDEEEEESGDDNLDEEFDVKDSKEEPGRDSGCTAVVALLQGNTVYVANAGDSRAVLCRGGTAIDLSFDHKPEDGPEMERIMGAGGRVTSDGRVNGGLNLSRALGDHTYKQVESLGATEQMIIALPDVKKEVIDLEQDEFVVLACDGIWNSMSSQEVVEFVRPLLATGEKISSICEKLFDKCLAPDTRGDGTGCDNMTCVIVQFLGAKQNGEPVKQLDSPAKRSGSPVVENESKRVKVDDEVA